MLLHMATRVLPDIRIIMIDTGYLFPETWAHMEDLRRRLDLNVWVYRTRNDPIEYLHKAGEENPTFRNDRDACCAVNKNEPINRAMKELVPRAWLRGIRRDQTADRKAAAVCGLVDPLRLLRDFPAVEVGQPGDFRLHEKAQSSLPSAIRKGLCVDRMQPALLHAPITTGDDPRSGRWAGTDKVECGINLANSLDSSHL